MNDQRALLRVEGLTKSFTAGGSGMRNGRRVRAVDDVSFTLDRGETLGLVGESGCGKTSVGRLVLRLIEADAGRVIFDGVDLGTLDSRRLRAMRRRLQLIFQDPYASLDPRLRIGAAIAAPIVLHDLRRGSAVDARVVELLELVGLSAAHRDRFAHQFSGGQRQRIAIARALAVEPELIVCDEPVSALDVSVQAQVLNLLRDLRARLGLSLIFISHDMSVVQHVADRVGVMYAGRMVEMAPAADLFANPRHPYTQALLAAVPIAVPRAGRRHALLAGEPPDPFAPQPGCAFASRCPHSVARCQLASPGLTPTQTRDHHVACWRADEVPPSSGLSGAIATGSPLTEQRLAILRARRDEAHP